MITSRRTSAFALAVILVLMALIIIVIVAYLANTRTDRSTSSIYANQLRAKMVADSGLTAATKLLADNTRYGNYITAMPPPVPSPAKLYSELYRPTDPANTTVAKANDYLQLSNAAGVILASRAVPSGTPQVDPRPTPVMIPPAGPFGIADPGFTAGNSYDFNQIVRVGTNASGRLVNPSSTPAFGQWVQVRNNNNELIGRYAFFMEDESMKININSTGNNNGGVNVRGNDLSLPPTPGTPTTQIEEIDPAAVLPPTANRAAADSLLVAQSTPPAKRLATASTIALLDQWNATYPDYAHLVTALSKDDNTTAKGWQRLNLNQLVTAAADNAAKVTLARKLSDWIRDAWTGPALNTLQESQLFGNDRLRLQISANIIDYIDSDNIPTDLGDIMPDGFPNPITALGIEKIPYPSAVFIIFESSNRVANMATMKMKIRFNFLNLFESTLNLQQSISRIEVQGVPVIFKKGAQVFNHYSQVYNIPVTSLVPLVGTGFDVLPGMDGTSNSGARTFETGWLVTGESVTFSTLSGLPTFQAGDVQVRAYGLNDERLDFTTAQTTDTPSTGYSRSGSTPSGDFLLDATPGPLTMAAIFLQEAIVDTSVTQLFGDPRHRPNLLNGRWRRLNFCDNQALTARLDSVDANPRIYGADWFDHIGDRPMAFHRDGPMLNIGELGNISAAEYPVRTLYLQYPERLPAGGGTTNVAQITTRRTNSVDYVLLDLFRTNDSITRSGGFNINSQQRYNTTQQHSLAPLFLSLPVGTQTLTQSPIDKVSRLSTTSVSATVSPIYDRRIAVGPPPDNTPLRPFLQIGDLASVLSRLVNLSGNTTIGTPARTIVNYSVLRDGVPTATTETNVNFQRDMSVEQEFREVSSSITTRGNVFRILYVGQAIKDSNANGTVDPQEVQSEYLGESFIERIANFQPVGPNPDSIQTIDSSYKVIATRVISQ
ncbi:MAG: hypothetical protein H0W34_04195 [Pyrinomonadaceae bacterium]|nr:hypothetical protein [Pyrinomonadaceae bacterium]